MNFNGSEKKRVWSEDLLPTMTNCNINQTTKSSLPCMHTSALLTKTSFQLKKKKAKKKKKIKPLSINFSTAISAVGYFIIHLKLLWKKKSFYLFLINSYTKQHPFKGYRFRYLKFYFCLVHKSKIIEQQMME